MLLTDVVRDAASRLEDAGVDAARSDAERLIADALDLTWSELWSHLRDPVDADDASRIDGVVTRRVEGEPLAYILGTAVFYGIEFACGPGVLVPRPETESLVDVALEQIDGVAAPVVADIGTGSGAIAVAIERECPRSDVYGVDVSEDALRWARRNVAALGSDVTLLQGDGLDALPDDLRGRVDLIASNPPYVPDGSGLPRDVHREPKVAVFGGPDGTDILRRLIAGAPDWLSPDGVMVLEVGQGWQADLACDAMVGWRDVSVRNDHTDRTRVVVGRRP